MITLQTGDILFQDLECGAICDAINGVTRGYKNADVNHCGIVGSVDGSKKVFEAIMPRVRSISIQDFLQRSVDEKARPRILVGRPNRDLQLLVSNALRFCLQTLGKNYDPLFYPDDNSFYCSELIVDAFRAANGGNNVFKEKPMSFRDPDTGEILSYWISYYSRFGAAVPEGVPGSNPADLSLEPGIDIIAQLGSLNGAPLP